MNIRCRECDKEIENTDALDHDEVRVLHTKCYTKMLQSFKDYGIRIGMRVHNKL